jgi:hypothetical protein
MTFFPEGGLTTTVFGRFSRGYRLLVRRTLSTLVRTRVEDRVVEQERRVEVVLEKKLCV